MPVAWSARVSRTLPPNSSHARRDAQIVGGDDDARDDPATRRAAVDVLDHRTAVDVGERLARERVEANRAGMTATTCERRNRESTVEPVDAGCTTNNSTRRSRRARATIRGRHPMNLKRTATIVVGGGGARRVARRRRRRRDRRRVAPMSIAADTAPIDAARRRARRRDRAPARAAAPDRAAAAAGAQSVSRSRARAAQRRRRSPRPRRSAIAPATPPTPPPPPLKLVGIAEDAGADGPVRTAIISGDGQLFLVKEGDDGHAALPRRRRSPPTSSSWSTSATTASRRLALR